MGIQDKPIAPASPWQNGFAERLIGSIRRECVDHIVVLGEAHLRRILKTYAGYYNKIRTHRSLDKDAPAFRPVQRVGNMRHTRSSVGFITITYGFRFSVQTGGPFYFGVLAAVVVFLIGQALRYVLAGKRAHATTGHADRALLSTRFLR
jgi:Integrase core domain